MLPPAPPRFSTITGVPSASPSGVAISRAAMSVPPPAGKQAIKVTLRSGQAARAVDPTPSSATPAAVIIRSMKLRDRAVDGMRSSPGDLIVLSD